MKLEVEHTKNPAMKGASSAEAPGPKKGRGSDVRLEG